ncbi:MAG: transketolase [Methanoregulaceae archaeon]|nr:transketolase [Methanoregulaceae archaeon]
MAASAPPDLHLETRCINVIRGLAIDAVQKANSGHPGMPMGAAPMAHALWTRHLRHNPRNPKWFNRDRFILSAGHGSMLLYALLHLTGYDLSLNDLKQFRQFGSRTPGHPENVATPGVEMATGPLGQGVSTAVGMAIAEAHLAAVFNRPDFPIVDHYTYGICSDGDLMEGIAQEACSLAGHLRLGKLIFLYDDNNITIDGRTDLAYTEDVTKKFEALGWQVLACDGMDIEAVDRCLTEAKANTERPTLIRARTIIGFGSPNRADTSKAHGEPLGADEVRLTKQALGLPEDEFYAPDEVVGYYRGAITDGGVAESGWIDLLSRYAQAFPDEAVRFHKALAGDVSEAVAALPTLSDKVATRAASGVMVNAVAPHLTGFLGGGADLTGNVNVVQKDGGVFSATNRAGRTIHYGVREHAMMAAVNGITLHGAARGFGGTFLIFSDYCKPSVRLAALMETPSIFVFTHDSIGLGEDGPTHQPVEQIAGLRAIPNLNVFRPADGHETAAAWKVALESKHTPTALILSRQALPCITPAFEGSHPAELGGYILRDVENPEVVLVGSGSELQLALAAADQMELRARVVSLPSWLLFERQDAEYRESVLPKGVPTVSVEAASTFGWGRYAQAHVGLDRFGASAPGDVNFRELGITAEAVVAAAKSLL